METFKELEKKLRAAVAAQVPEKSFTAMSEAARKASPYEAHLHKISLADHVRIQSTLLEALNTAAALEFATIPPYLVALWSIKDQTDPIAGSIRSIIHEEMTHLALACNLITGLGGTPSLTGDAAPRYPQSLPGGVHPELLIELGNLNDRTLETFLEIERPVHIVEIEDQQTTDIPDNDKTIGDFYGAVRLAAYALDPEFELGSQITGPLVPFVITNLADLDAAIDLILTQGEGATGTPYETGPDDLAHYYRFKEIQLERRLSWDPEAKILKLGEAFARPDTYSVNSPPASGYDSNVPDEIHGLSDAFNIRYSDMLGALEQAWGAGGHPALLRSMEFMFELKPIAQKMMRYDDGTGHGFIPEFQFV